MESGRPRVVLPVWKPHDGCASDGCNWCRGGKAEAVRGPWLPTPQTHPNYDVSTDGKRFLMVKPDDRDEGAREIVVVHNWCEELKQRMVSGKK